MKYRIWLLIPLLFVLILSDACEYISQTTQTTDTTNPVAVPSETLPSIPYGFYKSTGDIQYSIELNNDGTFESYLMLSDGKDVGTYKIDQDFLVLYDAVTNKVKVGWKFVYLDQYKCLYLYIPYYSGSSETRRIAFYRQ